MSHEVLGHKVSRWQDADPPEEGIWQIKVRVGVYFARYKGGQWSAGEKYISNVCSANKFIPFFRGKNSKIKWRGVLVEDVPECRHSYDFDGACVWCNEGST